jgi:hypothetical protein
MHQLTKVQARHGIRELASSALRPAVSISLQHDQPMTDHVERLHNIHHYSRQQVMSDGMNARCHRLVELAEFQEGYHF